MRRAYVSLIELATVVLATVVLATVVSSFYGISHLSLVFSSYTDVIYTKERFSHLCRLSSDTLAASIVSTVPIARRPQTAKSNFFLNREGSLVSSP